MTRRYRIKAGKVLMVLLLSGLLFRNHVNGYVLYYSSTNTPYRWDLSQTPVLHWTVQDGAPAIAHDAMVSATAAWTQATAGVIQFAEGPGEVTVVWDTTGTKLPDQIYLAFTTDGTGPQTNIVSSQIVVNASIYTWHRGGDPGVGPPVNGVRDANLDTVLLHELGHTLGLDHTDKNLAAIVGGYDPNDLPTMNSVITPEAGALHLDDEAGVRALYSAPPPGIAISASPAFGNAPLSVYFSSSPLGATDVVWDFGDGTSGTGSTASHTYTSGGGFNVIASRQGTNATFAINVYGKPSKRKKSPKTASTELKIPTQGGPKIPGTKLPSGYTSQP